MRIKFDVVTILVYVIVVVALWFAIFAEKKDMFCPGFRSKECGPGMGRAYAAGKPDIDDDTKTLFKKARLTARYEVNSIFWRRSIIAAVVSSFLILYTMKGKFPSGISLGIAFLITYIIIYLTFTLFQEWISKPALKQMDDILHILESRTRK